MNSPEVRAAADLAALLPTDHPLAQLGRLRLDVAVREQELTMIDLNGPVTSFDQYHDVNEHFIGGDMNPLQDGGLDPCTGCGRRILDDAPGHQHGLDCPNFTPHPLSIAAAKAAAIEA